MIKNLILKDRIKTHLGELNISFDVLAKKINASPSSLFNWSEGGAITLNDKNLKSLILLSELLEIDLPFLLFPIETAKRYRSSQKFNEVMNPLMQSIWTDITKEIRLLIKSELQNKS